MPTASERANAEKDTWAEIAESWGRREAPDLWADRPPSEHSVILFHDPVQDLDRRGKQWDFQVSPDVSSLASFAAGLAGAEAEGWNTAAGDVATRAYEARRFLVAERIIHWAVPWLDTVGRCYPPHRQSAHEHRDFLLTLGDEMRVAPVLPGREGLVPDGEDSYGPLDWDGPPEWLFSLWSGALLLRATLSSMGTDLRTISAPGLDTALSDELALLYESAAGRWRGLAGRYPGSAQIWLDLSERARRSASRLSASEEPPAG